MSRGAPTRARTLYGQPSWWGDGSDTFSTPPSHRKENKPDTPHPNKSIEPPNFNQSLPSAVYTHRVSYQATPPVSSRDTPATDRDPLVPQNALSSFHSANGDTRVNQKLVILSELEQILTGTRFEFVVVNMSICVCLERGRLVLL